MTTLPKETGRMIKEGLLAVNKAIGRSHLARAWDLLQEKNEDGDPLGPLPYTDEALDEFEVARELLPGDPGIIHHLAIAHHARAWDMELRNDPSAPDEWELALGYWRILEASGEFWAGLKDKLKTIDPEADPTALDAARKNLLEDLLDIHVGFILHHCELNQPDRAKVHVQIVIHARISPAIKKQLVGKVFEAMTDSVAQARQVEAYESALKPVEQFLAMFSDLPYLPALRLHVESCVAWVAGMSYQENWDEIRRLSRRAMPFVKQLLDHADLADNASARNAVEELAENMAMRGRDRAAGHMAALESGQGGAVDRDEAAAATEFAIIWGRLGYNYSRRDAFIRKILPGCLNMQALCWDRELNEVLESDVDNGTKLDVAIELCRKAVAALEEAITYEPDDSILVGNLDGFRRQLAELQEIKGRMDIFGDFGGIL